VRVLFSASATITSEAATTKEKINGKGYQWHQYQSKYPGGCSLRGPALPQSVSGGCYAADV
jgi:hypothetical protein